VVYEIRRDGKKELYIGQLKIKSADAGNPLVRKLGRHLYSRRAARICQW